jgi:hypothetical protein
MSPLGPGQIQINPLRDVVVIVEQSTLFGYRSRTAVAPVVGSFFHQASAVHLSQSKERPGYTREQYRNRSGCP